MRAEVTAWGKMRNSPVEVPIAKRVWQTDCMTSKKLFLMEEIVRIKAQSISTNELRIETVIGDNNEQKIDYV